MPGLTAEQQQLFALNVRIAELVAALEEANAAGSPLRCRELSCAITNIEQGGHWLSARLADLV
jgi:hypothetical protein